MPGRLNMRLTDFVCICQVSRPQKNLISKKSFLLHLNVYDIFCCPLDNQDKTSEPHKIRKKCYLGLHNWLNKWFTSMSFDVKPKIIVRIAIFVSPKQSAFPLNRKTKQHISI